METLARTLTAGTAAASAYIFVTRDRVTQPVRYALIRKLRNSETQEVEYYKRRVNALQVPGLETHSRGYSTNCDGTGNTTASYLLEYVMACALCSPMYYGAVAVVALRKQAGKRIFTPATAVEILAARYVAWFLLNKNGDLHRNQGHLDWPDGFTPVNGHLRTLSGHYDPQ